MRVPSGLPATWPQAWRAHCAIHGAAPAFRRKHRGIWETLSWQAWYQRSAYLAIAWSEFGLREGDGVLVLCGNRFEWPIADMAAQSLGAAITGVHPATTAVSLRALCAASDARIVLVEGARELALCREAGVVPVFGFTVVDTAGLPNDGLTLTPFDELLARGEALFQGGAARFAHAIDEATASRVAVREPDAIQPDHRASWTQGELLAALREESLRRPPRRTVSFVSQASLAERVRQWRVALAGGIVHFPEDSDTVLNDLREVMPDLVEAPLRFWLEQQDDVRAATEGASWLSRRVFGWATQSPRPGWARRVALRNVRRNLGLHRAQIVIPAGTAEAGSLRDWYRSIGVRVVADGAESGHASTPSARLALNAA